MLGGQKVEGLLWRVQLEEQGGERFSPQALAMACGSAATCRRS